jgi:IS5 family transposase
LAWRVTAANRNDITQLIPLLDAIPAVRGPRGGRPRSRPERILADRGYDSKKHRRILRARGIRHSIAERQSEHGSGLGSQRYVVERTISHLHAKRRLLVCTDRRQQTHEAFLSLAACLLCYRRLRDSFC